MKNITNFFSNHFLIFLVILVIISYGQLLFMQPWQEDNVIFFKVAHIDEQAGYLGKGIHGEGVYRHIITPYYLLYTIFGYNIVLFYSLALTFFFLSTLSVYYLFKNLINENSGRIASFLFGAGYIAYDGFVRIYNSISSSLGIIFLSWLFIFYWRYYKYKNTIYYFVAVLFYYLALEFSYIRTHYLLLPVIFFEFILFSIPFSFKKLFQSIFRSLPFILIFYKLYIEAGDSRKESILELVKSLVAGHLENTFSFFSTLGNLVIPDKIQGAILSITTAYKDPLDLIIAEAFFFCFFSTLIILLIKAQKKQKLILLPLFFLGIAWLFLSNYFFSKTTLIYSTPDTILASFIGGIFLVLGFTAVIKLKNNNQKLFLFFLLLIIGNLASYAAYTPTTPYTTGYRYLAHSFIGLIGIMVLIVNQFIKNKFPYYIAVSFGLMLLFLGITNMREIVETKSNRIDKFYTQLKNQVKYFPKDSLIYFDIQDNPEAISWFKVAFSVAEMPNTTAIAWRYGIDRYDIQMFNEYPELFAEIKKSNTNPSKIFTFFLTKDRLINTSERFRQIATNSTQLQTNLTLNMPTKINFKKSEEFTDISQEDLIINLPKPAVSLTPLELEFSIKSLPINLTNVVFPLKYQDTLNNPIYTNPELQKLAFEYQKEKKRNLTEAKYTTSSQWQDRIKSHLHDNDLSTIWQADRILWGSEKAYFVIELKEPQILSKLIWINGFANNTPTKYSIDLSLDGQKWETTTSINSSVRLEPTDVQITSFKPASAKFIRMNISETLSGDSPGIREAWALQEQFANLNLKFAEAFSNRPFDYIPTFKSFLQLIENIEKVGTAKISWMGDKGNYWISTNESSLRIIYDGVTRNYTVIIPPGGTEVNQIKISDMSIPEPIMINSIQIKSKNILNI